MSTPREVRARHESGHALIAWKHGVQIKCVCADESEDFLAYCQIDRATPHVLALISRGGAIAESIYTGQSESELWEALPTDKKCRDENDARCECECSTEQHDREARRIIEEHKDVLNYLLARFSGVPASTGPPQLLSLELQLRTAIRERKNKADWLWLRTVKESRAKSMKRSLIVLGLFGTLACSRPNTTEEAATMALKAYHKASRHSPEEVQSAITHQVTPRDSCIVQSCTRLSADRLRSVHLRCWDLCS